MQERRKGLWHIYFQDSVVFMRNQKTEGERQLYAQAPDLAERAWQPAGRCPPDAELGCLLWAPGHPHASRSQQNPGISVEDVCRFGGHSRQSARRYLLAACSLVNWVSSELSPVSITMPGSGPRLFGCPSPPLDFYFPGPCAAHFRDTWENIPQKMFTL